MGLDRALSSALPVRRRSKTNEQSIEHQAGFKKKEAFTGAVTLIQRYGSALNLNIHFHMLFLDGVYVSDGADNLAFVTTKPLL